MGNVCQCTLNIKLTNLILMNWLNNKKINKKYIKNLFFTCFYYITFYIIYYITFYIPYIQNKFDEPNSKLCLIADLHANWMVIDFYMYVLAVWSNIHVVTNILLNRNTQCLMAYCSSIHVCVCIHSWCLPVTECDWCDF